MLRSLTLYNFQAHSSLSVSFSPGLNLIVGPNWAGKTTLLRAVLYALFGGSAVPVRNEYLVTRGSNGMSVSLAFEVGGARYLVERGQRKATLSRDSELIASGQSPVTAEIEALIGHSKAFLAYRTARAGEVGALLTLGSAKLAQHIESILGIELVDQVLEKIRQRRSKIEAAGAALLVELAGQDVAIRDELHALNERETTLRHQLEGAVQDAAKWSELSQQWGSYTTALRSAVSARRDYLTRREVLERALTDAETRLQALGPELARPDCDPAALEPVLRSLREQHQQYEQHVKLQDALLADVQHYQNKLASLGPTEEEPEQPLQTLLEQQAAAQEGMTQAKLGLQSAQAQALQSTCMSCGRPFEGRDPEQSQRDVAAAQQALHDAGQALESLSVSVRAASEALMQVKARNLQRQQIREQMGRAEQRAGSIHVPAAVDVEHMALIEQQLARALEEKRAYEADQARRNVLVESVACAKAGLAGLVEAPEIDEQALAVAQEQLDSVNTALAAAEGSRHSLQGQHQQAQAELGRTLNRLSELEKRMEAAKNTQEQAALYDRLAKFLRTHRDQFTANAWGTLLDYASQLAREASAGAVQALNRNEKGEFEFVEDGRRFPIEVASGMQEAILGVSIKLALAAAIGSSFDVLLFDEVAAAGNDENALRLTQTLAKAGQQVILVSHRQADAAAASSVIAL